jgi:Ca2+-binding EF-hand superfamily protein
MFQKFDKNHQGYLTKIQFNQLFKQFDIHLNEEELYHIISEIDKNQDGIITYDELYYSLITNALQI